MLFRSAAKFEFERQFTDAFTGAQIIATPELFASTSDSLGMADKDTIDIARGVRDSECRPVRNCTVTTTVARRNDGQADSILLATGAEATSIDTGRDGQVIWNKVKGNYGLFFYELGEVGLMSAYFPK